jgi:hypothetical protein
MLNLKNIITLSMITAFSAAVLLCCCAGDAVKSLSKVKAADCCSKADKAKSQHSQKCGDCQNQYLKADGQASPYALAKPATPALPMVFAASQPFSHPVFTSRIAFSNGPPFPPGPALFLILHQFRI